jgi:hypothetical protein
LVSTEATEALRGVDFAAAAVTAKLVSENRVAAHAMAAALTCGLIVISVHERRQRAQELGDFTWYPQGGLTCPGRSAISSDSSIYSRDDKYLRYAVLE